MSNHTDSRCPDCKVQGSKQGEDKFRTWYYCHACRKRYCCIKNDGPAHQKHLDDAEKAHKNDKKERELDLHTNKSKFGRRTLKSRTKRGRGKGIAAIRKERALIKMLEESDIEVQSKVHARTLIENGTLAEFWANRQTRVVEREYGVIGMDEDELEEWLEDDSDETNCTCVECNPKYDKPSARKDGKDELISKIMENISKSNKSIVIDV